MSREGLYKALASDGNPSFATISKVAHALGLRIEFHAVVGRPGQQRWAYDPERWRP